MTNPAGPAGPTGSPNLSLGGATPGSLPPGPPLPADNPWVKSLALLFPDIPISTLQTYAAAFQQNMFQALNSEISRDLKQARAAAKKFKDSIEGND